MYFSIEEILPHVYHLRFGKQYDAAMHFIRYQEYYESPKFRKKIFSIAEYMRWYSETYGKGAFTYPKDWTGFNVPSWALKEVRYSANVMLAMDERREDVFMNCIIDAICEKEGDNPFYFIGTSLEGEKEEGKNLLDHEIAHALYYVSPEYRAPMNQLLTAWGDGEKFETKEYTKGLKVLGEMGYHQQTALDEMQAYCATGLCEELEGVIAKSTMRPFRKIFLEHKKKHVKE
jgi:hypothetical protein